MSFGKKHQFVKHTDDLRWVVFLYTCSLCSTSPPSASHRGLSMVLEKSWKQPRVGWPQSGQNKCCSFQSNSKYSLWNTITIHTVKCLGINGALDITVGFFSVRSHFVLFSLYGVAKLHECLQFLANNFFPFSSIFFSLLVGIDYSDALIKKHVRSTTKKPLDF